jgi:hypothetical protein
MPGLIQIRLPYPVPYTAQVASPELAGEIFSGRLDPRLDPRWAATGADTPEEYAHWTSRACGAACVKMCVDALGGPVLSLMDTIRRGEEIGAYLTERASPTETVERGWLHQGLAGMIQARGYWAKPQPAGLAEIAAQLAIGRLVIASVSYELGTTLPVTRQRGHLVVLVGMDLADGEAQTVWLHNPSGRDPSLQVNAAIPAGRFGQGFSGRVVLAGPAPD